MRKFLIFIFLLSELIFSQEIMKVPIDVENDRWIVVDYDIPGWGKNRWFYGSSSLNNWYFEPSFIIDKEYKIKGGFGWEIRFYLSKDGEIIIRDIEKGPYLLKPPVVKIISSGQKWNPQKRIRIMMPETIKINFRVPFEYGNYKINVFEKIFKGEYIFEFFEGEYVFEFEDGMKFILEVRKDIVKLKNINKGRFNFDESKIKINKENNQFLVELPVPDNVYKVEFEIPFYLYPVISKTYFLPGNYKINGRLDWEIEFSVDKDGIKILNVDKGNIINNLNVKSEKFKIYADSENISTIFFTSLKNENLNISDFLNRYELKNYNIFDEELKVCGLYLPEGKYKFGNIDFIIKDVRFASICVINNNGLKIELKDNFWETKRKHKIFSDIKGNFKNPYLTIYAKKYNEKWENYIKFYEGKCEKVIDIQVPEIEFENYTLRFNLKEDSVSQNPFDYVLSAEVPYFPIVSEGYKLYLYTKDNQKYFYQGKEIQFYIDIKKFGKPKENLLEILISDGKKEKILKKLGLFKIPEGEKNSEVISFALDTKNIKPGNYKLIAKAGRKTDEFEINIIDPVQETNFMLYAYGGEIEENIIKQLSETGLNAKINNGAISSGWINKRREFQFDFIFDTSIKNPYLIPFEKISGKSTIRKYYEDLIKNRIKLIAQYGCAHQFFHYSTCFLDPEIQKTIARDISLYLQIIKDYGVLYGINLGDEAGTPRGPTGWDDHCDICMEIFSKEKNLEIPFNIWDVDEWRKWVTKDEIWSSYYYFKQTQMPKLIKYVKELNDKILELPYHTQGGNLNYFSIDAGYPPISNSPYGFNTAHWYPHYGTTLWNLIGVEFMKMDRKRIPYLPLIWSCDDFYTTRHELYLCLLDGVDGLGHFHIPASLGHTSIKEIDQKKMLKEDVHPKLIKYGDLFKNLKPDKKIAVLFSFTQQIEDLKDCYDSENAVLNYSPSYRQVHRSGMCFLTLWRAHYPSSIISEEDIKNGKLGEFKILFISGVKKLPEDVKGKLEEFIENGGKVFVDKETEVNIKGAEKLNFDFSSWYWASQGVAEKTGKYEGFIPVDYPFTIPLIPEIEKIVSKYIKKEFDSSSPFLIISSLKSGDVEYILCLNDYQVEYEKRKSSMLAEYLPLKTDLKNFKDGFFYDLLENKEIVNKEDIELEIAPGDIKIFSILREKIGKIDLKIDKDNLIIKLISEKNKQIKGSIPIEITYIENSEVIKTIHRATDENGQYKDKLFVFSNTSYPLKVRVKELISNKENELTLRKSVLKDEIICKDKKEEKNLLKSLKDFISQNKQEIWIIYGNENEKRLIEKKIVPILKDEKVNYNLFESNSVPSKEFPYLLGRGIAKTPLGVPYYYYPLNLKIEAPVLLIGTPFTNKIVRELIKCEAIFDCNNYGKFYIGKGFRIFDWDYDTFLIISYLPETLEKIMKWR